MRGAAGRSCGVVAGQAKFLVDAQLPPAPVRWLRDAGHEAEHVEEVGLREAHDGTIWAHALQTGAIVVTQDEEFAARSVRDTSGPIIVWLRVGNTTSRALRAWIEPRLPSGGAIARAGQSRGGSALKTPIGLTPGESPPPGCQPDERWGSGLSGD